MQGDLAVWAAPRRTRLQTKLDALAAPVWPAAFGKACAYPLASGGKRMRPLLAYAAFEAIAADTSDTGPVDHAAMAVELVHTYSLVHDDLPAMDDADERRGEPSVHKVWDDAAAVLVGDGLLTEAFRVLATAPADPACALAMVRELSEAAGWIGMVGGQAADIGMGGPVDTLDALTRTEQLKTGALIRCACLMGGLAAQASPAQLDALRRFGDAAGLAFQLADDVLDEEEDAEDGGPPSFVKLLGRDETLARASELMDTAIQAAQELPRPEMLIALARYTIDRDI